MECEIRIATKEDTAAALELIRELAAYEREPDAVEVTLEEFVRDGFGPHPVYGMFVAAVAGKVVGIALYYIRYSTWKGRCLYLEDIVIKSDYRRMGIGSKLFERVMKETADNNYRLMAWQVLDWNESAINFYKKYNASLDGEWMNGRLDRERISKLLS